jgi:transcriptional regulator with XRE-family HTH domain
MDSILKKQFRELRKISGWTPAETARQLKCSRAHVSNIENDAKETNPSERLLEDFRNLIQREVAPAKYPSHVERIITTDPPEVEEAADQLREMHEKNPEAFKAAKVVIDTFYGGKFNSSPGRKAARAAKTAASKARNVSPKPKP